VDLNDQVDYVVEKLRRHNRFVHGFGIVCGLGVLLDGFAATISPGYALSPFGDEVQVCEDVILDLSKQFSEGYDKCNPSPLSINGTTLYLAIRPLECPTRAVRVQSDACGCDQGKCVFSRIRESFECKLLLEKPRAYVQREELFNIILPVIHKDEVNAPLCLPCPEDNWIILRKIFIDEGKFILDYLRRELLI
jgi:hypothetical protein